MSSICKRRTCGKCRILLKLPSSIACTYYYGRPEEFVIETGKKEAKENATSNSQDVENQDSDYDLGEYVNPNRVGVQDSSEEEDEDDEDEEDEEDQQSGEEEDEEENEQIEGEEKEDNN
jgi:hypothetical protein